ncbi:hypothetical protein B0H14DRAFT_3466232 [Mycena olivaceomarginata]|nr:hypothetical protein B0H14DRAFT_3466232 [Mycena olivaceomarginata]
MASSTLYNLCASPSSRPRPSVLIRLWRKYDFTNILATAVACIMCINPTTLDAYHDILLLVKGIAAALPAAYYRTLVVGNNNSPLLDGLMRQDGARVSLPPLDLIHARLAAHAAAEPRMRRCHGLRKSIFCCFMDDGVVVGLHKLDKACQVLCGACAKEAAEATATGHRKVWEELPGFCDCRLGELKDEL